VDSGEGEGMEVVSRGGEAVWVRDVERGRVDFCLYIQNGKILL
jgi:hypothetical protein